MILTYCSLLAVVYGPYAPTPTTRVGLYLIGVHARADLRAIVTASAQEPGRWQLTWFDDDGPSGHTHRDTAEEAIAAAIADGYHVLLTAYPEDARELVDGALEAQAARRREIESWLAEQ